MEASIRSRTVGLPLGETIFGKTCLVVGFGNIASELVPRSVGAVKPGHHQMGHTVA